MSIVDKNIKCTAEELKDFDGLMRSEKQLAIPHLITTIIYYKWTESIGMYINWGVLTDAQHELYSWAACGWVVIACVWIFILDNVNTKEKIE